MGVFVIYGIVEYWIHSRNLKSIPIRIEVNGTRGKSSVTRLIAAGLREGGVRTFAKTTGTRPCFIHEDGAEELIPRAGEANIREQLAVLRKAVQRGVKAIVVETMALRPDLQWVETHRLLKPTIGVITNVRLDHLEVMGTTLEEIAFCLSKTIPRRGEFFVLKGETYPVFQKTAENAAANLRVVDLNEVSEGDLKGFSYFEHRENLALALQVCSCLGVERGKALQGMYRTAPDPGVVRIYSIEENGKHIKWVNAFAANDPDSILLLWNSLSRVAEKKIVILNCRRDRVERSRQLGRLIAKSLRADHYILTGEATGVLRRAAFSSGLSADRLLDLGGCGTEEVYLKVMGLTERSSLVFGTGNIVGFGEELVNYFNKRGTIIDYRSDWLGTPDKHLSH